jgi:hypothetical protein
MSIRHIAFVPRSLLEVHKDAINREEGSVVILNSIQDPLSILDSCFYRDDIDTFS